MLKVLAKDLDASILSPSAFIDKVCFLSLVPLFLFFFSFFSFLFFFLFSLFSFLFSLFLFSLFSFLFSLFSFLFSLFPPPLPPSPFPLSPFPLLFSHPPHHSYGTHSSSSLSNTLPSAITSFPPISPPPVSSATNPFGMFPSHTSGGGGGGGGVGGDSGGGGGGSVGENSGMGSRDVSGRSKRYLKTYQMYLDCFQITPPTRYWPSPFEPSSSSSSSQKKRTREVDNPSSPPTKKPRSTTNTDTDIDRISLIVVGQDGSETHFTIRKTTPLRKLMSAWSQKENLERDDCCFLYNGQRLTGYETPVKLDMEEGDLVDASLIQKPQSTTNTDTDTDRISLIVVGQDGSETHFKIRKTTPLHKVMDAWCQKEGIQYHPSRVRFLLDSQQRLTGNGTPGELNMKDGDIVDAYVVQNGC